MLVRILFIIGILTVAAYSENNEKFFEIKLKPCNVKSQNSKFKEPNFYHPIYFDINLRKKTLKHPINIINACTVGNKLMFIKN
tara:strand:- start:76 stop:324 length:249 start_codon:yes stop_codon:yes gene_type:complete